jgi:acetoin utilization protein AcuC
LKIGITYHEKFRQYDLGPGHPFRGDRFVNVMRFFKKQGLVRLPNVTVLKPKPATRHDLLRVHDRDYVDFIFRLGHNRKQYDVETPVSLEILEAAMLIIGGALQIGTEIYEGTLNRGVALGCGLHHAGRNYGGGFCLFNDIAVLVEFLREKYGLKRVLILDYDVHFGNGTSDIYYADPTVLFISLHQDPRTLYPGKGFMEEIGKDDGEGYNVNIPLPPSTGDTSYLYALREIFVPLAEEFKPEIILGNGGSDPHFADKLGDLKLTAKGFFNLSKVIAETAEKVCDGKLVLMPGSGYNPEVLPRCWYALAAGAAGLKEINVDEPHGPPLEPERTRRSVREIVLSLKRILKNYWTCFK